MNYFIGLDVGGTHIKSALLSHTGELINQQINMIDSYAKEDKETILNHLCSIILNESKNMAETGHLLGVGLAFPGPFDYANGISLMQNINKYDSLYQINIKEELLNKLKASTLQPRLSDTFDIRFENDATLYALGEQVKGTVPPHGKCLCICIGTGLGSAFIEDCKVITHRSDVPTNGWVYDTPFKTSIIDDHLSARGLLNLYNTEASSPVTHVKPIADLALEGDALALATFTTFGQNLADGLNLFLDQFPATTLVIGGQIVKSYSLFEASLKLHLKTSPTIFISPDTSHSALVGVMKLFEGDTL